MLNFRFYTKKPLWTSTEEFNESWKKRIYKMAADIDIPGAVVDIGCGMMWLESQLNELNDYIPVDFVRRDERTIVLDLNKDTLPEFNASIAFLSGILEYVSDVGRLSQNLIGQGFDKIILSYCTVEKYPNIRWRKKLNWVSHLSIFELIALFTANYDIVRLDDLNGNTILVLERKMKRPQQLVTRSPARLASRV